jgi:hypothetical protein
MIPEKLDLRKVEVMFVSVLIISTVTTSRKTERNTGWVWSAYQKSVRCERPPRPNSNPHKEPLQ